MLSPPADARGPLPKHTPELMGALRALGHEVAGAPWGGRHERATWPRRALARLRDIGHVRRQLLRERFDVMVVKTAHDWATLARDIPLVLATRWRCPRVILQFHGSRSAQLVEPGSRLFKLASAWLVRLSAGALVLSSEEQRQWQAFCPARRFQVVSNPIVPLPAAVVSPACLQSLLPGAPVVLFVGRLMPEKGIFDLLDAFASIRRAPTSHLLVVGDGPHESLARDHAAALGLGARVTFTGYLEGAELAAAYRAATVFALPTTWPEGFPTVITEAMGAGLPIVTTRRRGMADHLGDGVNALFVPAGDARALATAVERLLADPGLRARMARANREKVREFLPDVVGPRYLDALRESAGIPTLPAGGRTRG
jgi:glycosyltransferase involved in cell wall biosynthesis